MPQIEILESVRDHKYTAVPAGHDLSKTYTASLAAWWWKMCHRPSKVVVTAPGNRQAAMVIGNEIRARWDGLARRWSGPGEMATFGIDTPPNTEGCEHAPEEIGIGCDVARFGDDLSVVCAVCRCGALLGMEGRQSQDTMATAGLVLAEAKRLGFSAGVAHKIAIDDTGVGGGVTDRLRELGWRTRAENFGGEPRDEETFANRRAELWWQLRDWIRQSAALASFDDPRRADRLVDDLTSPKYSHRSDSRVLLEPKSDIKKRIGRSPDYGDALALAVAARGRGAHFLEALVAAQRRFPDDEEDDRSDREEEERRMLRKKWGPYTDHWFPGNPLDVFPGRRERGGSRWDPPYR